MGFEKSLRLRPRFNELIPGGCHTYAKGDDQFPESCAPYIVRGKGSHLWDVDGNEYIEYGMGLRSVTLGHAWPSVVEAAYAQMQLGNNYNRPAPIELEAAEDLLGFIPGAEMVKFAKNGSDVLNGAVRLARAHTGRDLIAICAEHPFFSVEDWFIGTTAINAGIPQVIKDLTVKFHYNDIASVKAMFEAHRGKIACVILEAERETPPKDGFLHALQQECRANGTVFVLDEMITGFRWDNGGAQKVHGIVPDLSTFGKAIANGFSLGALVGKRELMEVGGLHHKKERVWLLSLTHGAENHSLAAARATMQVYRTEPVIETLRVRGEQLRAGVEKSVAELKLDGYFGVMGKACCLLYFTRDPEKKPSQPFRTLFLQETIKRGLLAPQLIMSYSHSEADIRRTVEAIHEALVIYRKALDEGVDKYLVGRPVAPVYRKFN
ncbi:MAG TPA: glutamate-1-semialdehyde 2,1-aminomutase [Gemmatimonadales bacterium]|nr:glutamate-1-semialdehyde 2,1-aminomutase [Gemmatimonadales bacterium]